MKCEDWVPDRFWMIVEPLLPPDKPTKPTDWAASTGAGRRSIRRRCLPLGVVLSGANRHDMKMAIPTLESIPPVAGVVEQRGDSEMPLGFWRWVVERTNSWLNQFHHLKVRYEILSEITSRS